MVDDFCYGPERQPWRQTVSEVAVTKNGKLLVSAPTSDPLSLDSYPEVAGVTSHWYQLLSSGLSPEQRQRALDETSAKVHTVASQMLGFQGNQKFHYPELAGFFKHYLNNQGNPFHQSQSTMHCDVKWFERNVLDYVASLWHAKWPHNPNDPESYWGYFAGIGSTEGNMHALLSARDYLSGMFVVSKKSEEHVPQPVSSYVKGTCPGNNSNALKPVAFFSEDSHFGIPKGCRVCNVPTFYDLGIELYRDECPLGGRWPHDVPCEHGDAGPGSIDVSALAKLVNFFAGKGHPIIIIFNYGSTFKGAYDNVKLAEEVLLPILKKNGLYKRKIVHPENPNIFEIRRGFWFHIDGALSCSYMPFIEMGYKQGLIHNAPGPIFDFRLDTVCSIVTSTAKWYGASWPSGIYLTKTGLQLRSPDDMPSFSSLEPLLSTSSAHSSLLMWSYISSHSFDDEIKKAKKALSIADYAEGRLRALQAALQTDLWVSRTCLSFAIYFKKPNHKIFKKFSLSSKSLYIDGELRDFCHIYIMEHVDKEIIDNLIEDLNLPGAFPPQ